MALATHVQMPGPGDLPGDSRNPNSPDNVEPAFDIVDATENVAGALAKNDEVAEVVADLYESALLLNWIAGNVSVPDGLLGRFRALDRHARRMVRLVDRELESLNDGPADEIIKGNADLTSEHASLGRAA